MLKLFDLLLKAYHDSGSGRSYYSPVSVVKAFMLQCLMRIPFESALADELTRIRDYRRICNFKRHRPGSGCFSARHLGDIFWDSPRNYLQKVNGCPNSLPQSARFPLSAEAIEPMVIFSSIIVGGFLMVIITCTLIGRISSDKVLWGIAGLLIIFAVQTFSS